MDINITYDMLFDVLRVEKSREELQKLDDDFYKNVAEYITSKESIIDNPNTTHAEKELTRIQLQNVKKLITELYDRREKKIINLAIYKIKTSTGTINAEVLLGEEEKLFSTLYAQLSKYRSNILSLILAGKAPSFDMPEPSYDAMTRNIDAVEDDSKAKSVRFIHAVPRFLGPELETYGPFEENDIASLPSKIANVLIRKERAEEIKSG